MSYQNPVTLDGKGAKHLSGENNVQTALPIGGIGAGCVCLNGQGGIQDFSIRNRPETTATPDGHTSYNDMAFGVVHLVNQNTPRHTLLVEGPLPFEKVYNFGLQAQGFRKGSTGGLPRFSNAEFTGAYPFGQVNLSDNDFPLTASVTGWNPFIPGDDEASGLPAAILEYCFKNSSAETVEFQFSYNLSHLAHQKSSEGDKKSRNRPIEGRGIHFYNEEHPGSEHFSSSALVSLSDAPDRIKAMWFRGTWFDDVTMLWKELSNGDLIPNDGSEADKAQGDNGGSILFQCSLKPGESKSFPIAFTWYYPNIGYTCGKQKTCCSDDSEPEWRPWYAGKWKDAADVADYLIKNGESLRERTQSFRKALFHSTLPDAAIDAIASNLSILKSPTVLRQENGDIWGWEGCFDNQGCCPGSCTHVWNYAQALPHLFPALERTLRNQEYKHAMDEAGHINFRFNLPTSTSTNHDGHPAADGQLGGIVKLYRDWQISGDDAWLKSLYKPARKSLEFCIQAWDPNEEGALIRPHHNTYDIEFSGPDGMCGSVYIGALTAMEKICEHFGDASLAKRYHELAEKAVTYLDRELYNGDYYFQKVIRPKEDETTFKALFHQGNGNDPESKKLLAEEGPKYQYGTGCLSDGIIGEWLANACGLQTPLTADHVRQSLQSIFKHNFKEDLSNHVNTQRPGYAVGNEAGLVICSWPFGERPSLPFVYSDEIWPGIEYQVASHLIMIGEVESGIRIVEAARSRFDGKKRNPWNEYECGSYYARSLSSFSLLQALSGFFYRLTDKTLEFGPKVSERPFRSFFSTETGFGTIELTEKSVLVEMVEGHLEIEQLILALDDNTQSLNIGKTATVGEKITLTDYK